MTTSPRARGVLLLRVGLGAPVTGCAAGIGPSAVRSQRGDYNATLQETNDQQLLLNLVRLRYAETPSFLEVTGIVAQLRLEIGGSAGATAGKEPGATLGTAVTYAEQPTITYVPSQGEQFARRFLAPMAPESLVLLWGSGWSFKRVARLGMQRINRVENVPRSSGPTPSRIRVDDRFEEVLDLMAQLVRDDAIAFELAGSAAGDAPRQGRTVLRIRDPGHPGLPALTRALDLAPDRPEYDLVTGGRPAAAPPWTAIHVETRSLLGILNFVASGVEIPAEHRRSGVAASTVDRTGRPVDWASVTGDVFRVRSSDAPPGAAVVAVRHRGRWFFIDDADVRSKTTFVLLTQIHALQAAAPIGTTPTLTLPLSR